jgi:hypothetical protein
MALVEVNRRHIRVSLGNVRAATAPVDEPVDRLNRIVAENRLPIRQFTRGASPLGSAGGNRG